LLGRIAVAEIQLYWHTLGPQLCNSTNHACEL
jgi:hypothetical protein